MTLRDLYANLLLNKSRVSYITHKDLVLFINTDTLMDFLLIPYVIYKYNISHVNLDSTVIHNTIHFFQIY